MSSEGQWPAVGLLQGSSFPSDHGALCVHGRFCFGCIREQKSWSVLFWFCLKKYWPCISPSMMSLVPLVSSSWEIVHCLVISPLRIWCGCPHENKRWDQVIASFWITVIGCCQYYQATPRSGQNCSLHGGSSLPKILLPITTLRLLPVPV